jgi:hypothetical protein
MVFLLCSDHFCDYSPCVSAGQELFYLFLYEFFLPMLRLVSNIWPVSVSMGIISALGPCGDGIPALTHEALQAD